MLAWTARCSDVHVELVNTAPRRPAQEPRVWRRAMQGVGQARRDLVGVLAHLFRHRPDTVHIATSGGLALARDACVLLLTRLLRIRSSYHLHFGRLPETADRGGMERAGFRLAMRLCTTVVVLDQASAAAAAKIQPAATVVLIPYFIDASEWRGAPPVPSASATLSPTARPRRMRILYVGWVNEAKGMRELMTASAALAARHDFELVLAGPGDPAFCSELEALAGPSAAWYRLVGEVPREEVRPLMAATDILVLPSHSEGFPYAILEAMSMGRAIVATSVGAVPQMLTHEGEPAGELVPPHDASALEKALDKLLADPVRRAELGERARRAVERRFTIEAARGWYLELWTGKAGRRDR